MTPEAEKLHDKLKLSNVEMQTRESPRQLGVLTYNPLGSGFIVVTFKKDPEGLQDFKTLDDVLKTWEIAKP
jgi:hypothetical protein